MKKVPVCLAVIIFLIFSAQLFSQTAGSTDLRLSDSPGIYSGDVVLTVYEGSRDIYYKIQESTQAAAVAYQFPLKLTALKGEERSYSIQFFVSGPRGLEPAAGGRWVIDKKAPAKPETDMRPGHYAGRMELRFDERPDLLFYSLNGDITGSPQKWDGGSNFS